jgi:hypothetical protein
MMETYMMQRRQQLQQMMTVHVLVYFLVIFYRCPCSTAAFTSFPIGGTIPKLQQHYQDLSSSSTSLPLMSFLPAVQDKQQYPSRIGSHLFSSTNNRKRENAITDKKYQRVHNGKQQHGQEKGHGRNWMEKSSPIGIGKLIAAAGPTETTTTTTSSSKIIQDDTNNHATQDIEGYYDLGIHGLSFQTGPLSLRMYDALLSMASKRFQQEQGTMELPLELECIYKMYAMDMTAREAVKAALDQNGLELALGPRVSSSKKDSNQGLGQHQLQEEEFWGDVDTIQLVIHSESEDDGPMEGMNEVKGEYDSFDSAVRSGHWEPGKTFNFIVRNVPARLKGFDIAKLLQSFDADGVYRKKSTGSKNSTVNRPVASLDVSSLKELGIENERRSNNAPCHVSDTQSVYRGDGSQGYDVIHKSELLLDSRNRNGSENSATAMHVMNSLVSHGCLVVDLTDGGTSYADAYKIAKMWNASQYLFDEIQQDGNVLKQQQSLPGLKPVDGTVSAHAVVGYASYDEGAMNFLETRIIHHKTDASTGKYGRNIIPCEAVDILGDQHVKHIMESFDILANIGKDIVRVAVAAVNKQYDAFALMKQKDQSSSPLKLCSDAAEFLVQELIDDGKRFTNKNSKNGKHFTNNNRKSSAGHSHAHDDTCYVSMSPHRLCRYEGMANTNPNGDDKGSSQEENDTWEEEIFGAHTDTSFITLVPVAAISGLEIFDEDANTWLRPELLARDWWEDEQIMRGADPSANTERIRIFDSGDANDNVAPEDANIMDIVLPWHCRYVVAMPGDLLQLVTRNEVVSAVHRVVGSGAKNNNNNNKMDNDNIVGGEARLSCPVLLRARSGKVMNASKYFGDEKTWNAIVKESNGMTMDDIHNALQPFNYD